MNNLVDDRETVIEVSLFGVQTEIYKIGIIHQNKYRCNVEGLTLISF